MKRNSSLPNMSDVIHSWQSDYIAYLIKKELKDFEIVETRRKIKFKGIIQVSNGEKLDIKNIGERIFNEFTLHTTYRFDLDDIIEVNKVRYRINNRRQDITYYGFYKYNLVEDIEHKEQND